MDHFAAMCFYGLRIAFVSVSAIRSLLFVLDTSIHSSDSLRRALSLISGNCRGNCRTIFLETLCVREEQTLIVVALASFLIIEHTRFLDSIATL